MSGCALPEINTEAAITLIERVGGLISITSIVGIVTLRGKVADLRGKISGSIRTDSSGLQYLPTPMQKRLLEYSFSCRVYFFMGTIFLVLVAVATYAIIASGAPDRLPPSLACIANTCVWVALVTSVVSLLPLGDLLVHFLRLHREADKSS